MGINIPDHIQEPPIDPPEHGYKDEHTCPQCGHEWLDDDDYAACPECGLEWPKDCNSCELSRCFTECPHNKGGK